MRIDDIMQSSILIHNDDEVKNMSMKAIKIIDTIGIILFILLIAIIFVLPDVQHDLLTLVFSIIYCSSAWITGAGLLVTCIWGKGKNGLVLGVIMVICYLITAYITMFGLIMLTSEWELLWYIHPILIILGSVIAFWIRSREKHMLIDKEEGCHGFKD